MAGKSKNTNYDFSGYATKYNVRCTDGRIIVPNAFKHMDGVKVPLVWQHMHDEAGNVLGHVILEHRDNDGVYVYGYLNATDGGKDAKVLILHKDIDAMSIHANKVIEKRKVVEHGNIKEVSLVLGGANKGAVIDNINIVHGDDESYELEDELIMSFGEQIEFQHSGQKSDNQDDGDQDEEDLEHADEDMTVGEVFNSLTDLQKEVVYVLLGEALNEGGADLEQSDDEGEGDMKRNVFDGKKNKDEGVSFTHEDMQNVFSDAVKLGSLRKAFEANDINPADVFSHAGATYGIHEDSIGYLFPDNKSLTNPPTWFKRDTGWVGGWMAGVRKSPFSRIKSLYADLTPDAVRAKGYVTGNLKVEEVFAILTRSTTPTTVYKKQKMDRDDVVDITDFDVIAWLKSEMRMMLEEELARAMLVSDGRTLPDDDKIAEANIRPIYQDDHIYSHKVSLEVTVTDWADIIDEVIKARKEYKGKGQPNLYCTPETLTNMLLLKDTTGRRIYRNVTELAQELRVKQVVEVEVMEGVQRDNTTPAFTADLLMILVNPSDYNVGADKGGQTAMFDDFDIDYNQYKYLIETRISGALVDPKTAICIERKTA